MLYTNGNTLFKLKSEKQLLILFLIFSIFLGSSIYFFLSQKILPYSFEIIEKTKRSFQSEFFFLRDFQNNGAFYKFRLTKNIVHDYYKIDVFKPDSKHFDQHNFKGKVSVHFVSFHDWNQDEIEELFVLSTKADTVYLTVIDIMNKSKYINEQVIIAGSLNDKKNWDISNVATDLMDVNGDGKLDLVFGFRAGLAKYPRGILTYDISEKKLINKYLFNAGFYDFNLIDLDNDGNKEIVAISSAVGNISKNDKLIKLFDYNDFYSWLFVFDKDLKLKYPAQKYGTYSSGLQALVHNYNKENQLLVYTTQQNENSGFYLLNNKLEKIKHVPIKKMMLLNYIGDENNYLISRSYDGSNFLINKKLDVVKKLNGEELLLFIGEISINKISAFYTFISVNDKIQVFDSDFKLLAEFNPNEKTLPYEIFIKTNPYINKGNEINFHTNEHFYQVKLVESNLYSLIPYLSILSSILFFFLFIYTNKLSQVLYRRFKAYGFLINQSKKAVVILDKDGLIKSYNDYFVELVSNAAFLKKNEFYGHFIIDKPELKKFIDNSIQSKREHKKEISIKIKNEHINIITTVYPIISFWGYAISYIIELDDITNPIMDERQKVWAQTSQKIAHDIKTPLSTIQLNLKALNQRVDRENFRNKDDFKDDLDMISSEVGRIRDLTKSFLQFANLEQPKLAKISIKDIIERSLIQFKNYFHNGTRLETSFQKDDINVFADASQLDHLFHIIIENAVDSMNNEGIIEIKTIIRGESKNNSFVDIEITDNGIGINEDEMNNIFDPYYTTKKDGNGMGLAIAKKIVEDNNGNIKVYSKEGLGTTITISFALVK